MSTSETTYQFVAIEAVKYQLSQAESNQTLAELKFKTPESRAGLHFWDGDVQLTAQRYIDNQAARARVLRETVKWLQGLKT